MNDPIVRMARSRGGKLRRAAQAAGARTGALEADARRSRTLLSPGQSFYGSAFRPGSAFAQRDAQPDLVKAADSDDRDC